MPSRDGLLDKPMLAACGEVCDLTILDQWMRRGPLLQDPSRAQRAGGVGTEACKSMVDAAQSENVLKTGCCRGCSRSCLTCCRAPSRLRGLSKAAVWQVPGSSISGCSLHRRFTRGITSGAAFLAMV